MQVILMDKVAKLGDLGDVVKVRDGYARNFLIPTGRAKRVTPENLAVFEARRAELEKAAAERLTAARTVAEKLEGVTVQIARKAGVDGRLFGSVSTGDIADALVAQSFEVDKSMVRMPDGPVKTVSEGQYEIALHSDVVAIVTVAVVGES
ncbi:MAG: 50S ribosomal protein L9 [Gammaproteobacteria bacterium]|jgi:large subunit ribosomal protein L9|nr:50S ribosomal protein L9 [Gammaproteobacteria bacterium]MBU0771847.1 50S ribosomal protein L9 [Gammaproteobacteria bacterium]MBU0856132.1 50S ribosomal protein L9 [Gammaproteobacteria bacterium]MBU1846165.1 50S ribosomal protein L9 [Gammaproteobacteria bacterium]